MRTGPVAFSRRIFHPRGGIEPAPSASGRHQNSTRWQIRPASTRKAVVRMASTNKACKKSNWYVVQVFKGREEFMAGLITRVAPASVLEECFYPRFATEIKVRGRWVPVEKPLFPGYLIAITHNPEGLDRVLLSMPEPARVLTLGDIYVPLGADEAELIGAFTRPGERVVPMSMGVKEGDRVVVTSGPLVGRQGLIRAMNRRKSIAYLELDLCGRRVSTRVGLGIVSSDGTAVARRAGMYASEARKSA